MPYDLIATADYLPSKNVFLVDVDMSAYLLEYYIQRKDYAGIVSSLQDEQLKDLICCFAIHLAGRTAFETHAWTLNIVSEHPYSLFVTGSSGEMDENGLVKSTIVGNVLTENIRHSDTNGFHAQCTRRGSTFNSYVPCDTSSIAGMVEHFYRKSEQLPIRIALSANSDTGAGIIALPGFDRDWFESADIAQLLRYNETKTRMRTCKFEFKCDCSPEKLLPFFRALSQKELQEIYGDDKELLITCPRCGKRFVIGRELVAPI
ncbi:MAG: Hsp33 family molecular chaperone HslO [Deltaproteobacteria bacterium]|nr:Hsp33 family molecular chaperone HslO [Deltaproteobacteria bacterium]